MNMHVSNEPFAMLNLYNAKILIDIVIVSINAYQSFKKWKNLLEYSIVRFFILESFTKNLILFKNNYWMIYVCISPKDIVCWTSPKTLGLRN
jgi:hypothetical protein